MKRPAWPWLAGVVGVLVVVLVAGSVWVQRQLHPPGSAGPEVRVVVDRGLSTSDVAELLERKGIVDSASVFLSYVRLRGGVAVQAGEYRLRRGDDLGRILDILDRGAEPERGDRLTIPEGLTLAQIAEAVGRLPGRSAPRFLEVARSGAVRSAHQPVGVSDLEGLMLPETYQIGPVEDETAILRRLVGAFDDVATRIDLAGRAARLGITPYQAVVVASMVEREARVDVDRGPIARVIYNRLERRMPLQIDATVQYVLGKQKERLLYSDLEVVSPYNTYKVGGLPPGPIASPGWPALDAALDPPPAPWIYYVLAEPDGRHAFATTGQEFERLKAEAQRKGLL